MTSKTVSVENAVNTTLTTTSETVIATLTGVSTSSPGRTVRFKGMAKITTGTAATALNLRIRRDSLTGDEVTESNVVQVEAAAGSTEDHDISGDDPRDSEVFNATYVLTAQQTAATGDGTAVYAYLAADVE